MDELTLSELTSGGNLGARIDTLLRNYAEATGEQLRRPLTPEDAARVHLWMLRSDRWLVFYQGPSQKGYVHASAADKAGFIQQKACEVCELLPLSGPGARPRFPDLRAALHQAERRDA
ncbi:hypothetical protein ACFXPT_01585 [Streptomyces goshikiensis]|uniref:hypothetical protein n=1 Tax=Streptomyces goshikiensis TaxID=1942 RepID=UPI0036C717FA